MADKSVSSTGTVHIEIFGATYTVKAGADPGYVEELAAHVDAQMREVSKTAHMAYGLWRCCTREPPGAGKPSCVHAAISYTP